VLPQLLTAFEFGNAGAVVLTPLFKVKDIFGIALTLTHVVHCKEKVGSKAASSFNTVIAIFCLW